jgi:hypothetical protein
MSIELQGLSELDKELADQLWRLDTAQEVEAFIQSLPRRLRLRALTVFQLICVAAVDEAVAEKQQFEEVSEYLQRFS